MRSKIIDALSEFVGLSDVQRGATKKFRHLKMDVAKLYNVKEIYSYRSDRKNRILLGRPAPGRFRVEGFVERSDKRVYMREV